VSDFEQKKAKVEIFCSYSHKDDDLRQQFNKSVALMRRRGLVETWSDHRILAGDDWGGEIDEHLNTADIIALFVSSDFLDSDFCYEKELERAMEREAKREAVVVPIIVRPCLWKDAPFAKLQVTPPEGKAVTLWENRDEAWTEVAKSLQLTVGNLLLARLGAGVPELKFANVELPQIQVSKKTADWFKSLMTGQSAAEDILKPTEDAQMQKIKRARIAADIQDKLFQLERDGILNRTKTHDKAFTSMDTYIRE
jgi:hypothetical protein